MSVMQVYKWKSSTTTTRKWSRKCFSGSY